MKRSIAIAFAVILLLGAAGFVTMWALEINPMAPLMRLLPTKEEIGASARFSDSELAAGADAVGAYVKNFAGGVEHIVKVLYDEEKGDRFVQGDYDSGLFAKENTMVFFVTFVTGAHHIAALNPSDVYTDYAVILTRDGTGVWTVADAGY